MKKKICDFVLYQPHDGGDEYILIAWMVPNKALLEDIQRSTTQNQKPLEYDVMLAKAIREHMTRSTTVYLPLKNIVITSSIGIAHCQLSAGSKKPMKKVAFTLREQAEAELASAKERKNLAKVEALKKAAEGLSYEDYLALSSHFLVGGRVTQELLNAHNLIMKEKLSAVLGVAS